MRNSTTYAALSAVARAIVQHTQCTAHTPHTTLDLLALNRLHEPLGSTGTKHAAQVPVKSLTIATSCGRCSEAIVEMDLTKYQDNVPHPYCDLCMDALIRRYPKGVL